MRIFLLLTVLYTVSALGVGFISMILRRPFDAVTFLMFFLLPVVFIYPGFFTNKTPVPVDQMVGFYLPWSARPHPPIHNPALSDIATQFVPWSKAVRMAFKEGSLPFRNRWNGCGMPLAANGSSAAFSPFTFLMFGLPLATAFVLLGALKLFLASSGMWLWLSELGVSRQGARFGAIAFAFSFAMTPLLYHPATAVICLLPWALFAIEMLWNRSRPGRAFWMLVAILTLWPLCGHIEVVALGALFGGLWLFGSALAGDFRRTLDVLGKTALAAVLAVGLSAFSLFPQAVAIEASNRLVLALNPTELQWVKPYKPGWLGGFYTSFFPRTFGDMIDSPMIAGAGGSMTEMGFGYFGIVGWACALLILRPGSSRLRIAWVLLALIIFGFGGAMGLSPFKAFLDLLPGIRLTPPLRIFMFASLAGSALAALELDRLLKDWARNRRAAIFPALVAAGLALFALITARHFHPLHAAVGGLASQRQALTWTLGLLLLYGLSFGALILRRGLSPSRAVILMVTALSATELIHQGMRLYRFGSPANMYPPTPLIRFLQARTGPFRVLGEEEAVFPNSNVFAGVEEIRTHDPIERRDYVEFLDATCGYPPAEYFKRIQDFNAPALDFLNVKYLISRPGRQAPGPKWKAVYSDFDGTVFENRNVLPRLFAPAEVHIAPRQNVGGLRGFKNAMAAFGQPLRQFLSGGDFHGKALLLGTTSGSEPTKPERNDRVATSRLHESINRVSFHASVKDGARSAVLVSSFVQDGGWSATDGTGHRLSVGLVNGPFLAILLPAGEYAVDLKYVAPGFRKGLAVSLGTLCGIGVVLLMKKRKGAGTTPLRRSGGP